MNKDTACTYVHKTMHDCIRSIYTRPTPTWFHRARGGGHRHLSLASSAMVRRAGEVEGARSLPNRALRQPSPLPPLDKLTTVLEEALHKVSLLACFLRVVLPRQWKERRKHSSTAAAVVAVEGSKGFEKVAVCVLICMLLTFSWLAKRASRSCAN